MKFSLEKAFITVNDKYRETSFLPSPKEVNGFDFVKRRKEFLDVILGAIDKNKTAEFRADAVHLIVVLIDQLFILPFSFAQLSSELELKKEIREEIEKFVDEIASTQIGEDAPAGYPEHQ